MHCNYYGLHRYDCRSLMIPRFYLNFNYFHLICLYLIVAAPKVGKSDLFFNLSFRVLLYQIILATKKRNLEGLLRRKRCCGVSLSCATLQATHAVNIRAWKIAGTWRSRKLLLIKKYREHFSRQLWLNHCPLCQGWSRQRNKGWIIKEARPYSQDWIHILFLA